MNLPSLVCPYDRKLLERLGGNDIVLRIKDPSEIESVVAGAEDLSIHLVGILIESERPLDEIEFVDEWKGVPIHIFATSLGKFRHIVAYLPLFRKPDIQVYLPADKKENIEALQVLASVGIHCGVIFNGKKLQWDALTELMTYAILELVPHAPIEPFSFIAKNYNPRSPVDWGVVYFEDPKQYLHIDKEGRAALSHRELLKGKYITDDIIKIVSNDDYQSFLIQIDKRKQQFLDLHPCAFCAAWKICLGWFAEGRKPPGGCSHFVSEMLEVIEQYQMQEKARKQQKEIKA